jgi:PAS domain S-box-containing protein
VTDSDFRTAFDQAPVGMVVSRERTIVACNQQLLAIFRAGHAAQLEGRSFELLYPTHEEFERTGARIVAALDKRGYYADDRVMRRLDGELFWCHVTGRALDPKKPHAAGIWCFEDLSAKRKLSAELTAREREIAALLVEGLTSKRIGQKLVISPRTVDVYRARLMRKYGAATTTELVNKVLSA